MRTVDRAVGAAIALLGVAVFWSSRGFPNVPGQKLGASTLPGIVAAGLFVCGLLLLLRSARAARYARAAAPTAAAERVGPAVGIVASILLYLVASDALGYLVVAPLSLLLALKSLRVGWGRAIGWSVVASLAVHLAFYKLLKVPLPWGVLPVLY